MQRQEFTSSIGRMHKMKGLEYKDKPNVTPQKIAAKEPGTWIVSHDVEDPTVDTDNLDKVFYSVQPLDVIKIKPGKYEVSHLDIRYPILIQGEGEAPKDVELSIKSKSLMEMNKTNLKKLEFRNLTIRNNNKTFPGGFISLKGVHIIFRQCELLFGQTEIGIEGLKNSTVDFDKTFFASSHRSTGIHLHHNSKLLMSRSTLRNHKVALYGDIEDFDGNVRIDQTLFDKNRSAGITLYGGKSKITNSQFTRNLVGIQLRKKGNHKVLKSVVSNNEKVGIEIQGKVEAQIDETDIFDNREEGLVIYDQVVSSSFERGKIYGHQTAIKLYKDSHFSIRSSNVSKTEKTALSVSGDSHIKINDVDIQEAQTAIDMTRSVGDIQKLTVQDITFGLIARDKSQIKGSDVSFKNVKERIRNEYESSLIELK